MFSVGHGLSRAQVSTGGALPLVWSSDPAHKSSSYTLSNDDKTATRTGNTNEWHMVKSATTRNSAQGGKFYAELVGPALNENVFGFVVSETNPWDGVPSWSGQSWPGRTTDTSGINLSNGRIYVYTSYTNNPTQFIGPTYTAGDPRIIRLFIDFDNGWFHYAVETLFADTQPNVMPTHNNFKLVAPNKDYHIAWSRFANVGSTTIISSEAALSYPLPAGYQFWGNP